MTNWTKEVCGNELPEELQLVSPDTYIQRKNIRYVAGISAVDEMQGMDDHYECFSRFITVDEYNNLAEIKNMKAEEAIDAYTLQLMEEGLL